MIIDFLEIVVLRFSTKLKKSPNHKGLSSICTFVFSTFGYKISTVNIEYLFDFVKSYVQFFAFFLSNSSHMLSTNSHKNCRLSTSSTRIIFSHHHTAVPSQHPASVSPPPEPALPKVCQCALTPCSALTFSDIVSTLSI